jgi:hypothetical protein
MTGSLDRFRAVADVEFHGGYPTDDAARTLSEELYFQRATQAYLWALPAVNMYAMKKGLGAVAGTGYNVMSVYEKRLKTNTVITTPNSDVIYCMGFADLTETGPLVLEAPPKIQGLLDDFWHRPLTGPNIDGVQYLGDIGIPGPDKGNGGKYLVVPTGQKIEDLGVDLREYFVYDCPTNGVFIFQRGFFQSVDDLAPGVKAVEGLVIRPLKGEVKPMDFQHVSDLSANAVRPRRHLFRHAQRTDPERTTRRRRPLYARCARRHWHHQGRGFCPQRSAARAAGHGCADWVEAGEEHRRALRPGTERTLVVRSALGRARQDRTR